VSIQCIWHTHWLSQRTVRTALLVFDESHQLVIRCSARDNSQCHFFVSNMTGIIDTNLSWHSHTDCIIHCTHTVYHCRLAGVGQRGGRLLRQAAGAVHRRGEAHADPARRQQAHGLREQPGQPHQDRVGAAGALGPCSVAQQ
jgi:hypothetical protein